MKTQIENTYKIGDKVAVKPYKELRDDEWVLNCPNNQQFCDMHLTISRAVNHESMKGIYYEMEEYEYPLFPERILIRS